MTFTEQWTRPVVGLVELELPRPPSKNDLYYHGRVKTPRYRAWIRAAGNEINRHRPGRIDGRYLMRIEMGADARPDLGNIETALSDLLQAHGIINNDRLADGISIVRVTDLGPHMIRVYLVPSNAMSAK